MYTSSVHRLYAHDPSDYDVAEKETGELVPAPFL